MRGHRAKPPSIQYINIGRTINIQRRTLQRRRLQRRLLQRRLSSLACCSVPSVCLFATVSVATLCRVQLSLDETYADIAPVRLAGNGVSAFVSPARKRERP
jgi:hypothetical protein